MMQRLSGNKEGLWLLSRLLADTPDRSVASGRALRRPNGALEKKSTGGKVFSDAFVRFFMRIHRLALRKLASLQRKRISLQCSSILFPCIWGGAGRGGGLRAASSGCFLFPEDDWLWNAIYRLTENIFDWGESERLSSCCREARFRRIGMSETSSDRLWSVKLDRIWNGILCLTSLNALNVP